MSILKKKIRTFKIGKVTMQTFKIGKKYVHINLRHGGSIKTAYAIACMRAP